MSGLGRNGGTYGMPYGGYYPGAYMPGMAGYQVPGYAGQGMQAGAPQGMQQPGQMNANPQMTKPTVHADIVQIENEAAGQNEPVDAGTSQMMITKDETAILIKSVLANGETTMDIYRKIPKAPKPAEPEYVTRAEFERWIAEISSRTEPEMPRQSLRLLREEPEEAEDDGGDRDDAPAPRTTQRRNTTGGKRR